MIELPEPSARLSAAEISQIDSSVRDAAQRFINTMEKRSPRTFYMVKYGTLPRELRAPLRAVGNQFRQFDASSSSRLHPYAENVEVGLTVGYFLGKEIVGDRNVLRLNAEITEDYMRRLGDFPYQRDYDDWILHAGAAGVQKIRELLPIELLNHPSEEEPGRETEREFYLAGLGYVFSKSVRLLTEQKMSVFSVKDAGAVRDIEADLREIGRLARSGGDITVVDFGISGEQ